MGALVVGLLGNLYSRVCKGQAYPAMVTGVLFLIPVSLILSSYMPYPEGSFSLVSLLSVENRILGMTSLPESFKVSGIVISNLKCIDEAFNLISVHWCHGWIGFVELASLLEHCST